MSEATARDDRDDHGRAVLDAIDGAADVNVIERLLHSAVCCGFPRALNPTLTAKDVFADIGLLPLT